MSVNHIYAIALSNPAGTPTWAISVQPKKTKRLFGHDSAHTSVFLGNEKGTSATEQVKGQELLVKMLIGENNIAGIDKKAADTLQPITQPDSVAWLRSAATALQAGGLINHFSIDAFMQMAQETLKSQQEHHEAVAVEVDFLSELGRTKSVEEMHETRDKALKKGKNNSFFGFWISRPQGPPRELRRVNSWEREDDAYGGLM